ncbi:MAG: M20/M25/M40 family metallo-hydrolase, partial [Planctomycetota bacterium]
MNPIPSTFALLGTLVFVGSCHAPATPREDDAPLENSLHLANGIRLENWAGPISERELASTIRLLSSDLYEGRGVGTRGDELARAYIRSEFERLGLVPSGDNDSYDQTVPILGLTAKVESTLRGKGKGTEVAFDAATDYTAVAGNLDQTAQWNDAELVFIGYGIDAPEQQWDDFKGQDLRGKVVLVMNNDPSSDPSLFAGTTRLYYGRWSYKYEEAARRGALGAIVIHTTPSAGYPFQVTQAGHGRENYWLPFDPKEPTLPVRSWCSEDAARRLCTLGGHDLDALRSKAESRDFAPVPLGVTVSLQLRNTQRELRSGNVLGLLPGSDPTLSSEVVVVTAHFDHLGIGAEKRGDAIYNGALDNATGVAGMLAIARACAAMEPRPARSILFAAVTAEESGLLGSSWLAQHLPCDRTKVVANYNIDGLAIWGETRDIEFIGYGKNSLTEVAEAVARDRGRTVKPDSNPDLGLFYRSDHFNFARIGVPAAYFKAGSEFVDRADDRRRVKASYTATDYHQPSDEFSRRWHLEGAALDVQFVLDCLLCTCDGPVPTWSPGDE